MKYIILLFLIYNVYCYVLMRWDKVAAINNRDRIPERTLLLHAAAIGSLGILLGMYFPSNHKTKILKFRLGVPSFLFLHAALVAYICFKNH